MAAIPASNPTVIPAAEKKVYDIYYLLELRIDGKDPNQPNVAVAALQKGRIAEDGSAELSPVDNPVYLRIDDVLALAQKDDNLAKTIEAILGYLVKYGTEQGLL